MTDKHKANVPVVGWASITGIPGPTPIYSETCATCGRPVRRMTGLRSSFSGPVFWHSSGEPKPDDPRRAPRSKAWREAISKGMTEANARRAARRNRGYPE